MKPLVALFALCACGNHAQPPASGSNAGSARPATPADARIVVVPKSWTDAIANYDPKGIELCAMLTSDDKPPPGATVMLPAADFAKLGNVTTLCLMGGGLTELPAELAHLAKLESLQIQDQRVHAMPELAKLVHLKTLEVTYTPTLDLAALSVPPQVTTLSLRGNASKVMPAALATTLAIDHLYLDVNALTAVPPAVLKLAHLADLDLGKNQLTSLAGIAALHELGVLDVEDNHLTEVPPAMWELPALWHVNLANNPIHKLPNLDKAEHLSELDVTGVPLDPDEVDRLFALAEARPNLHITGLGTPVTSLDKALADPMRTYVLDLSGAKPIGTLPASIGKLTELRTLILDNQKLKALPPELAKLTKLNVLSLRNNGLVHVPLAITALKQLRTLDLDSNALEDLPDELGALGELRSLAVRRNPIRALPATLGNLAKLQELDADDCRLDALPPELAKATELRELWMFGNALQTIPPEIAKLPHLYLFIVEDDKLDRQIQDAHYGYIRTTPYDGSGDVWDQRTHSSANGYVISDLDRLADDTRIIMLYGINSINLDYVRAKRSPLRSLYYVGTDSMPSPDGTTVAAERLDEVPDEIGEMTTLAELGFPNNHLRKLPTTLGKLKRLRRLDLSNNDLRALPPWLFQLDAITNLRNNPKIDKTLEELHPLVRFKLPDGKPALIALEVFGEHTQLCTNDAVIEVVRLGAKPNENALATFSACTSYIGGTPDPKLQLTTKDVLDLDWKQAIALADDGHSLTVTIPVADPALAHQVLRWDDHGDPPKPP